MKKNEFLRKDILHKHTQMAEPWFRRMLLCRLAFVI